MEQKFYDKDIIKVKASQLPLCCPMDGINVSKNHPQIALPLNQKKREVTCPYCGTKFILI